MPFRVGQKVACINDSNFDARYGEILPVKGRQGEFGFVDVGHRETFFNSVRSAGRQCNRHEPVVSPPSPCIG
jgi:hypothetical protein